jgi:hypothetical protein
MDKNNKPSSDKSSDPKVGQGFNDSRGEIDDKKDIPKGNGQNLDNDPAHLAEKEKNQKR